MESDNKVILKKEGSLLVLHFKDTQVKYDFNGNEFISKTGRAVKVSTVKNQIRGIYFINEEESNPIYVKLFHLIRRRHKLSNLGSVLERLRCYTMEEKYLSQGFNVRFSLNYYEKEMLNTFMTKRLRDICIKREICINDLASLLYCVPTGNDATYLLQYIYTVDEVLDNGIKDNVGPRNFYRTYLGDSNARFVRDIVHLIQDYNYKPKSLVKYLINIFEYEAVDFETIPTYLHDCVSMNTKMGGKINKYPRYLHTTHDIVASNYNNYVEPKSVKAFEERINLNLEYKPIRGEFNIIYPRAYQEIQKEGAELHHCVASYVDRVIEGKCHIVFLRYKESLDESLVTVEVIGEVITQYRGKYNRKLTQKEMNFLKKYAEINKLKLS